MKKTIYVILGFGMLLSTTSCWDFRRDQAEKDAKSKGHQTLLEAESSKKAMIEEAKAKNEAANLNAEAEIKRAKAQAQAGVERAKGVAEANKIIGESLKGNEAYLRYLQIDAIRYSEGEKIYVPTEAGLPILEAK